MKLIFDTHLWLDAMVFKHPGVTALLATLDACHAALLATPAMLDELSQVLSRPYFKLNHTQQAECRARIGGRITVCPPAPDCRLACTDPADQMFIDLAVAQQVDALLSRDKALLRLRHRARQRFGLIIATPEAYRVAPAGQAAPPLVDTLTE